MNRQQLKILPGNLLKNGSASQILSLCKVTEKFDHLYKITKAGIPLVFLIEFAMKLRQAELVEKGSTRKV